MAIGGMERTFTSASRSSLGMRDRSVASRRSLALLAVCSVFVACTVVSLIWDSQASLLLRGIDLPGDFAKAVNLSEAFAHGFGAAAILGTLLIVATPRRRAIWIAVAITATSGLLANGLKSVAVRIRPHAESSIVVGSASDGQSALHAVTSSAGIPEVVEASFWDARQRSFPSGHAATAWGLAIGLSLAFPQGRWIFFSLAVLASLQRVTSGAHFPSDVFAGAAVAFASSGMLLCVPRLRNEFQHVDETLSAG